MNLKSLLRALDLEILITDGIVQTDFIKRSLKTRAFPANTQGRRILPHLPPSTVAGQRTPCRLTRSAPSPAWQQAIQHGLHASHRRPPKPRPFPSNRVWAGRGPPTSEPNRCAARPAHRFSALEFQVGGGGGGNAGANRPSRPAVPAKHASPQTTRKISCWQAQRPGTAGAPAPARGQVRVSRPVWQSSERDCRRPAAA